MSEMLVGCLITTALLYIGRCWGQQEKRVTVSAVVVKPTAQEPEFSHTEGGNRVCKPIRQKG